MLFIGLLLLLCSLAQAQTPTPCNVPDQWEGDSHFLDVKIGLLKFIRISYDAVNERVATKSSANIRGKTETLGIILLYKEKRFYFFDPVDEKCVVLITTREFQPAGVPDNATFVRNIAFGFGNNTVHTNVFLYDYQVRQRTKEGSYLSNPNCLYSNDSPDPDTETEETNKHQPCPPPMQIHNRTLIGSFTTDLCAPVHDAVFGDYNPWLGYRETLYSLNFHDLTQGIASPDVFDPPSYCENSAADARFIAGLKWHRFMYI
jgi:hypothetical protein